MRQLENPKNWKNPPAIYNLKAEKHWPISLSFFKLKVLS